MATLMPCGTNAAYQRHVNNGEPIDDACQQAQLEYGRSYRAKRASQRGPRWGWGSDWGAR